MGLCKLRTSDKIASLRVTGRGKVDFSRHFRNFWSRGSRRAAILTQCLNFGDAPRRARRRFQGHVTTFRWCARWSLRQSWRHRRVHEVPDLSLSERAVEDANLVDGAGEEIRGAGAGHPGADLERAGDGRERGRLRGALRRAIEVGAERRSVVDEGDVLPAAVGDGGAEGAVDTAVPEGDDAVAEVEVAQAPHGEDRFVRRAGGV